MSDPDRKRRQSSRAATRVRGSRVGHVVGRDGVENEGCLGSESGGSYSGVPVHALGPPFTDHHVVRRERDVDGGSINKVDRVVFRDGEASFDAFVKVNVNLGDLPRVPMGPYWAGIPYENTRTTERVLALSGLDRLLGTEVLPRTERASLDGIPNGVAMEVARGKQPESMTDDEKARAYADGNVRRDLRSLQLLDSLSSEIDRHWKNLFVSLPDEHGQGGGAQGIDNDFGFGTSKLSRDIHGKIPHGFNYGPPKFIDSAVHERLLGIRPKDVRTVLEPHLNDKEIEAMVARLGQLQEHAKGLALNGKVLGSKEEWEAVDLNAFGERFKPDDPDERPAVRYVENYFY